MLIRVLKYTVGVIAVLVLLLAGVLVFVNTSTGRDWVSGYASLYSGQSVLIEGGISTRLAPIGVSFANVSVAGDEGNPWLRLDRVMVTLPHLGWPPAIDKPLQVRVRGGDFDVEAFRLAREWVEEDDTPPAALPELPFAIAGSVENFAVQTAVEMFPAVQVTLAELSLTPDGARLRINAALGDNALRADLALDKREDAQDEAAANLNGTLQFEGLSVAARGMISDYVNLRGFDVVMTAGGDIGDQAGVAGVFTGENITGRLSGDFGALTFDMERLEASTRHGEIRLSARIHQEGDRLIMDHGDLNVATEDLAAFLGDFGIASTLATPAELNAAVQGGQDGVDVNRLRLTLGDEEVMVSGSGRVLRGPGAQARIEDAELSMVVVDSKALMTALGYDSPIVGRLVADASISGTREQLSIDNLSVDLDDAGISALATGTLQWPDSSREFALDIEQLEATTRHGAVRLSARVYQDGDQLIMERGDLNATTKDFAAFLADFDIASPLATPAELNASLQGGQDGVDINQLRFTLGDEEVVVSGSGRVLRDPEASARLEDAELSMVVEDSESLMTTLGFDYPIVGRLVADASIRGTREQLSIDNLSVDLGDAAITALANGTFQWPESSRELVLDIRATGSTIASSLPRVPMPQWFGEQGEASATLSFNEGMFALASLDARFESERGRAHVTGDIGQLNNITADNLELTLEAAPVESDKPQGLERLNLALGLPQGLDAPAEVTIEGETGYGQFSFEGNIALPREQSGINGAFRFEADPAVVPGTGPGDDGGSVLQGGITVLDLQQRSFEVTASLAGTEGTLSYRGALDESLAGTGVLNINGMNLNVLTALAGTRTNFPRPGDFQANIAHHAGGMELTDIVLFTGGTRIQGSVGILLPDETYPVARVTIEGASQEVYLADLGMEAEVYSGSRIIVEGVSEEAPHTDLEAGPERARYFSDARLGFDGLNRADLDVRLDIARLHTKALDYRDVRLAGTSRSGVLELSSTQQLLGGGGSRLDVNVDARGEAPAVTFALSLEAIDPGYLRTIGDQENYTGDVDVEVDLTGSGNSVREILGNANGHFLIRINHAVIPNRQLNLLSADFLFETLRTVNPFVRQSEVMDIECGLVAFVVRDGRALADKTVVIRGKRLLIVAEGEINLGNEQVAMVIRPKAQEGIGLNTSGLVKFIGIGGTLTDPRVRTDPKGLLMTGASLGAAVASGGMSLFLQNIFDRLTTSGQGCERIEAAFRDQLAAAPGAARQGPNESMSDVAHPAERQLRDR